MEESKECITAKQLYKQVGYVKANQTRPSSYQIP